MKLRPRTLLLEDDPADADLILATLAKTGIDCEAVRVETQTDFISTLEKGGFDLILSDYSLPTFDGLSALTIARVKAVNVPFIFVSGNIGEEVAIETLKSGATDYVLKQRLSRLGPAVRRAIAEVQERSARQDAERARSEAELQYRLFFENNPLPGWLWDVGSLRFLNVNEAAVRHYGYSHEEFFSMSILDLQPAEDARFLEQQIPAIVSGLVQEGRRRHRKKDGSIIDVDIVYQVLARPQPAVFALAHDITEQLSLAEQLRQSQKMEAIGTLAGGVAHDFNNLLGVIIGYCDLLLKKAPEGHPMQRGLSEIAKAADRAASLTKQLLAFSRRQMIRPRILDLNSIVWGVEAMLRRLISEDIELTVACHPELWKVNVDGGQMEQVLMNLVVNARDAMPHGGQITIETVNVAWEGGRVEHREVAAGEYVMLAVSDTGCGMDEEVRSHIFEPFFTTKEEGKGTGLGLSTVYGIIKQSQGHIWVYSEIGVGTTFKIYLPAIRESEPVVDEQPVRQGARRGSETVLVVEDQALLRGMICEVLEGHGYKLFVAQEGNEALEIFRQHPESVDLVLTDVVMPKMSGPQLAEEVAARYPSVKVLFMSGYADEAIVRHGILAHSGELLQKPFTAEGLLHRVQTVLDA